MLSTGNYILQQTINALSLGSVYALVAIGLAMVFGILQLINFAHGDLMMLSCYVFFFLAAAGVPFVAALLLAVLAGALMGVVMERVAYRRLRGRASVSMLLSSLAVSIILQNLVILVESPQARSFPAPDYLSTPLRLGVLTTSTIDVITVAAAVALLIGLTLLVTRTRVGIAMRAAADDLMAANLVGINLNSVIVFAFAVGSALAAVAGFLWATRVGKFDPMMGFLPVLKAFVAAVIGGFGSLPGAVLGGYVLGFLEIFLIGFLPPGLSTFRDALVFFILIVVLLIRPNGILGSTEGEKV